MYAFSGVRNLKDKMCPHSVPPRADIKNVKLASTSPYIFMAWCLSSGLTLRCKTIAFYDAMPWHLADINNFGVTRCIHRQGRSKQSRGKWYVNIGYSETLVPVHHSAWHHTPEDCTGKPPLTNIMCSLKCVSWMFMSWIYFCPKRYH